MKINVMKKGDKVINVTQNFVAVERKTGEVDIIPIIYDENEIRIDNERIITIGYGNNVVEVEKGDVKITTF